MFGAHQAMAANASLLDIKGTIGPAVSDYIHRGMQQAQDKGADIIILRMDTPGGLDAAIRDIIRDILASSVPVVAFVAPSGARAASAGTYILYAAHIAAMAPGTNVGAATPVRIGGIPSPSRSPEGPGKSGKAKLQANAIDAIEKKALNDAVAYIRSLAAMRGRNADWAARAVREAASLPAEDALRMGVIDIMAMDIPALLKKLDGRTVKMHLAEVRLKTSNARIRTIAPDWRSRLLAMITDPNIAYILMLLGVWGAVLRICPPRGCTARCRRCYLSVACPVHISGTAHQLHRPGPDPARHRADDCRGLRAKLWCARPGRSRGLCHRLHHAAGYRRAGF